MNCVQPIGVFDSGYGGLTVFKSIISFLPEYDYIYLGDNARAPYGNRSFETVYQYTLECVQWLFSKGCPLVILACNTASAKALRNIQQKDLHLFAGKKVLGVIRPTTEIIGDFSNSKHIGILGTEGTIQSDSYKIEIEKYFPEVVLTQVACPMWVPLIENGAYLTEGADYFIQKNIDELLQTDCNIDTILLACTHYPILMDKIKRHLPAGIKIVSQGEIVAKSLIKYLQNHPEISNVLTKNKYIQFFTTDDNNDFDKHAALFFGQDVNSIRLHLPLG